MNDLLFPVEESLSPRLKWMREHGIGINDCGLNFSDGDESPETGEQLYRYLAYCGERESGGHTLDEALISLAQKLNIPLWNESPGPHVAESDQ